MGPGIAYFPAISLSFKESVAFNFGSRPLRYPFFFSLFVVCCYYFLIFEHLRSQQIESSNPIELLRKAFYPQLFISVPEWDFAWPLKPQCLALFHSALFCFALPCFLFSFVLLCFTFCFTLLCFALFCFTFCFTLLCFALPFFCFTLFSFALFWLFLLCLFCFVWQALVCSAIRWRILKNSLSHNGCKGFYMTFHKLSCFKRRFLNFLLLHVSCGRLSSPSGPSNCWPLQSQEAAGIHEECDVYWHRHTGRTDVHTILH